VHGSALFTRGETQSFATATIGSLDEAQNVDDLRGDKKKKFMLHYNFPPFSVGEVRKFGGISRREEGHGELARKSIESIIPVEAKFPYSIRIVSDITESNGSSSMASVCAGVLSLYNAGVPMQCFVSGIAMGLVKVGRKYVVLSDITGSEDANGDMDFKISGNAEGITALQLDTKTKGVPFKNIVESIDQALVGLNSICAKMEVVVVGMQKEREESGIGPCFVQMHIEKDRIRDLIGQGGKVIKEICYTSGAKVNVNEDGLVRISASSRNCKDRAIQMINEIMYGPENGSVHEGEVVKIERNGVFVSFCNGRQQGMISVDDLKDDVNFKIGEDPPNSP